MLLLVGFSLLFVNKASRKQQTKKSYNILQVSDINRTKWEQNRLGPVNKKLNLMLAALLSFHLHLNWMRRINSLEKKKNSNNWACSVWAPSSSEPAALEARISISSASPRFPSNTTTTAHHPHHRFAHPPPRFAGSLILPSLSTPPLSPSSPSPLPPPPLPRDVQTHTLHTDTHIRILHPWRNHPQLPTRALALPPSLSLFAYICLFLLLCPSFKKSNSFHISTKPNILWYIKSWVWFPYFYIF